MKKYDKIIYNGQIFDGQAFVDTFGLIIHHGRIQQLLTEAEFEQCREEAKTLIDAQGNIVMPGMIDLQLNGCGGVLFNDEQSIDVLEVMNATNVKYGCTGFLATLVTSGDDKIMNALTCVKDAMMDKTAGVLGIHLEGPMISAEKKGIHQPQFIRTLSDEMLEKMYAYHDVIKMMTVAPERVEETMLDALTKHNIHLSIGHSNATLEECEQKGQYFTHVTHLWNAMKPREGRDPGVVGYVLNNNRLFTGIIADGIHVHPKNIYLAAQLLPETLYVTTDAVTPAGRDDITSFVLEGNTIYVQKDKSCRNQEGRLGGANITMIESVQYLVETAQIKIEQALKMATSIPARAIYISDEKGYIKENYIADVVIVEKENWQVQQTFQNGEMVYCRQ